MSIIDFIKIIGAIAAVVGASYTILNSKRFILKSIDRKKDKVRRIDNELIRRYGLNRSPFGPQTKLDIRKKRLIDQIKELERLL